jgi:hypothetical protein
MLCSFVSEEIMWQGRSFVTHGLKILHFSFIVLCPSSSVKDIKEHSVFREMRGQNNYLVSPSNRPVTNVSACLSV